MFSVQKHNVAYRNVFVLKGGHVLGVAGRRHISPRLVSMAAAPKQKKWRYRRGQADMAAVLFWGERKQLGLGYLQACGALTAQMQLVCYVKCVKV